MKDNTQRDLLGLYPVASFKIAVKFQSDLIFQELPAHHVAHHVQIVILAVKIYGIDEVVKLACCQILAKRIEGAYDGLPLERRTCKRSGQLVLKTVEHFVLFLGVVEYAVCKYHVLPPELRSSAAPAAHVLISLRPTLPSISR